MRERKERVGKRKEDGGLAVYFIRVRIERWREKK